MKDGKCPKCSSNNIYVNRRGIDWGSKSQWVEIWFGTPDSRINSWADFDSYVCIDCGYFENYILDREALGEIQAKWKKAS
jgi:predicted nucleic-acid-binding Zn-ribbon protein